MTETTISADCPRPVKNKGCDTWSVAIPWLKPLLVEYGVHLGRVQIVGLYVEGFPNLLNGLREHMTGFDTEALEQELEKWVGLVRFRHWQ